MESLRVSKLYINGEFCDASNGSTFEICNPYDLSLVGTAPLATAADINRAIDGAYIAFADFKRSTAYERAHLLRLLYDQMIIHEQEIAHIMTLEQGKPLSEAITEVRYAASYVKWYAEEGIRIKGDIVESHVSNQRLMVTKEPLGTVGIITPWNFPLAMFVRKLAPAIAAGCTVIVKPAEQTPLTAHAFFELVHAVGFPAGVCQLITGDGPQIGKAFMESFKINKVSFTGSTEVGQLLASQSGTTLKKLSLELGGHAPFIVFDDANIEEAVRGLIDAKFRNCGQTCVAVNRVFVSNKILDVFTQALAERVRALQVGSGFEQVDLGPIIDYAGYDKIHLQVADALNKGAHLCAFSALPEDPSGGWFYPATVLTNINSTMVITQEETFGPVVAIMSFEDEAEVISLANNTPYGLAAYFFTQNMARVFRVQESLDYGMIGVNTGRISTAQVPFGGVKMSGYGREGGTYGIEEYLKTKYIALGGIE